MDFVLNPMADEGLDKPRVIIVGNGPSLQGSGLGEFIDEFDIVVRFNSYRTAGYEKDVGSKIDIYVRCSTALNHHNRTDEEWMSYKEVCFTDPWSDPAGAYKAITKRIETLPVRPNMQHMAKDFSKRLRQEMRDVCELKSAKDAHPSSGLRACKWFYRRWGNPVHIVGFDGMDRKKKRHYYPREWKHLTHEPSNEKKFMLHLLQSGIVIPARS